MLWSHRLVQQICVLLRASSRLLQPLSSFRHVRSNRRRVQRSLEQLEIRQVMAGGVVFNPALIYAPLLPRHTTTTAFVGPMVSGPATTTANVAPINLPARAAPVAAPPVVNAPVSNAPVQNTPPVANAAPQSSPPTTVTTPLPKTTTTPVTTSSTPNPAIPSNTTQVPSTPAQFRANEYVLRYATLTWRDTSENESKFLIQVSLDYGKNWHTIDSVAANPGSGKLVSWHSPQRLSLRPYHYRVIASNTLGNSEPTAAAYLFPTPFWMI